ncbi:tyrosine-type recombinase/integrase [Deinococcus pimensis]|uniref:tyrosine-type recombinase/integrase n=1 Tax=Deinococcus pimensis TaxID=309888 RepID=UPI0004AFBB29|nr:tyrosine-type recombinase/integrase [Deinococcus pimensis]
MESIHLAVKDFLHDCRRRVSPNTLSYYDSALRAFTEHCQTHGIEHVEDLTRRSVRQYAESLDGILSPGGAHARLRALRVFIKWAMREELLATSPLPHALMPKVPQPELEVVTPTEMQALLTASKGRRMPLRNKAILLTLFDTGLRASELCGLQIKDLLPDSTLYVRLGKGAKDRRVPVSKPTRRAIQAYVDKERPRTDRTTLFLSQTGGPLTTSGLRQLLEHLCEDAGIPIKTPHAFRRGFAVSFVKHGADLVRLRDALGHTTVTMSTRYAVMSTEDLKELHREASPVMHLGRKGRED